jgi:hypothetical protein
MPVTGVLIAAPVIVIGLLVSGYLPGLTGVIQVGIFVTVTLGVGIAVVATAAQNTLKLSKSQEEKLLSALDEAEPNESEASLTGPERAQSEVPREDLIKALQQWGELFGEPPSEEFVSEYGPYVQPEGDSQSIYRDTFGSWEDALTAANLEPIDEESRSKREDSRLEVLAKIGEFQDEHGEHPSPTQLRESTGVLLDTIAHLFGEGKTAYYLASISPPIESDELAGLVESPLTIDRIGALLNTVEDQLNAAERQLSADDPEAATATLSSVKDRLSKAEAVVENSGFVLPDRYDTLRERYSSAQSACRKEEVAGSLDTIEEELEDVRAQLSVHDVEAAKRHLSTVDDRLSEVEDVDTELPDQQKRLRSRFDSLQTVIETTERAFSQLDTAERCLETADSHVSEEEFTSAKTQLTTAKGRLTRAENEFDQAEVSLPDRHQVLRSRCQSVEERIEAKQRRAQAEAAVGAAAEAMEAGYSAYQDGELAAAASNFEAVPEQLETAHRLDVESGELSTDESPASIAVKSARGRIYVEMQRAEQRIAEGHNATENGAHGAAVEAYEDALSTLRSASAVASEHGLSHQWELDHRQEAVAKYLDETKDKRVAADEDRLETARERLDRATRLVETAEQHLELDDSVAAWEDTQQARDVVDGAIELLEQTSANTAESEQRASELLDRIETTVADIPEQVRMDETAATPSKRDLLTYLQELTVIFGESPKEKFVEAYGAYPLSAYLESFGSWEATLSEANLAPIDTQARDRRVYSRTDILDAIVDLADQLGGVPSKTQMNEQGAVSSTTVESRFETWEIAVHLAGLGAEPTLEVVQELAAGDGVADRTNQQRTGVDTSETTGGTRTGEDNTASDGDEKNEHKEETIDEILNDIEQLLEDES